jgi:hypothetical protein
MSSERGWRHLIARAGERLGSRPMRRRIHLRTRIYAALLDAAERRGLSLDDASDQAMWLWTCVVNELDAPNIMQLRVVDDELDEAEQYGPPGTILLRRRDGEIAWLLPPPGLGRPRKRRGSGDQSL